MPLGDEYNLEHFFALSPDLLCIAGYDGYFKRISPSVYKLLGYTEAELFAMPINEFVYPDDRDITARNRESLTRDIPLLNFENRYVTKSGEIVWLSWTSMPVDAEKLVYAIAKNITHKKKLEEDRNTLLANLTKINHDLKQITYATSHDLRAPVSNLLSVFSLLDASRIQDEETLKFLHLLKLATEGVSKTLNNYVDVLSQKDSLRIQVEELDLNSCLQAALTSLSSLTANAKATINTDFSEVEKITFNRVYLQSIFLNLVTNSIKYARPDVPPVISISSKKVNDIVQLVFTDNGLGFNMDKVKDRLFGFHQSFHSNVDSKGIGLYLVYNHVTSLGGSITVESKINEGATFTISIKA